VAVEVQLPLLLVRAVAVLAVAVLVQGLAEQVME
jgi:hypothetical protein